MTRVILGLLLMLAGPVQAAEMHMGQVLPGLGQTPSYWPLCNSTWYQGTWTNPTQGAIVVKQIQLAVVGSDGMTGEAALWVVRGNGEQVWSAGWEVFTPSEKKERMDFGDHGITLQNGEGLTVWAQCINNLFGQVVPVKTWVPVANFHWITP